MWFARFQLHVLGPHETREEALADALMLPAMRTAWGKGQDKPGTFTVTTARNPEGTIDVVEYDHRTGIVIRDLQGKPVALIGRIHGWRMLTPEEAAWNVDHPPPPKRRGRGLAIKPEDRRARAKAKRRGPGRPRKPVVPWKIPE